MIIWAIIMAMVLMIVDIGLLIMYLYKKTHLVPGIISLLVVPAVLVYGITENALLGLSMSMMMIGGVMILMGYFTREQGLYLMSIVPAIMGLIMMISGLMPGELMSAQITIGGPTVVGTILLLALILIIFAGLMLLKVSRSRGINIAIYLMASGLMMLYLSAILSVGMSAVAVLSSLV